MTVLVDSSAFIALMVESERHHQRVVELVRDLRRQHTQLLVITPVLLEVFQVTLKLAGYTRAIRTLATLREISEIADLTGADYDRMQSIMTQYADAELDFADAAIMALSERLNITQVATLDRRDFGLFRPTHCDALELLPAPLTT